MNKQEKELLSQLLSEKQEVIIKALEGLKEYGTEESITPVMQLWINTDNTDIIKNIEHIFMNIRISRAPEIIISNLKNGEYNSILTRVMHTMWNSGLDYTRFIPELVDFAIAGNFEQALEALTVIENQEGEFNEEITMEALIRIKNYAEKTKEKDAQKAKLIAAIKTFIHEIDGTL